jgi:hypothetical protein
MNKLIEIIKKEFQTELAKEPFHVLDLGCSGGISADWRLLEPYLKVIGIDLNVEEVEKLNKEEKNKAIKYLAGNLDLSPDHPIRKARGGPFVCHSHRAFARTSAWDAHTRTQKQRESGNPSTKPDHVDLPDLLKSQGFSYVDFIKIDVDGPDFDLLQALEPHLERLQVLGFKMEVNFNGTTDPHDHTFHNMDRLMRKNGFELYDLELRRYTKKALPGKFLFNFFGQTETGALAQGDAVYIKRIELEKFSKTKIAKTIVLLTLFGQIDSAADLIKEGPFRESLRQAWLDYAAQLFSHKNYKDLMRKWEKTPTAFFRDGMPK